MEFVGHGVVCSSEFCKRTFEFFVALEALNVKFEEIAVILKLLFSGDAHSPRFLILVTVIIILVIVLFTLIQLLGIPFHLVVRVQIIINQLTV